MTAPEADPGAAVDAGPLALARPGSRLVLAGTGSHPEGSRLLPVPQVAASLADLETVLRERAGTGDANLRVLLDPPSPLEFGRAVARAAAEATDALLVYYAGHGLIGRDDALYLATSATGDLLDDLAFSALPYAALRQAFASCRARTIAVVLDCCFSGRAELPDGPTVFDAAFEQTPVRGGFLLAATAREELGLARPGAVHTAFTGALIRLLRDGDEAGLEYLTLDDVYRSLSRALPEEGAPRPRRQSSDHAGELVVARNPAFRSRPAPSPRVGGTRAVGGDGSALKPGDQGGGPGIAAARPAWCPYRGLPAYGPEDARYFFGRAAIVRQIARRIVGEGGLIAVVGASGSGKTSLLRAGVVPAIEALPPGWTVASMTPGADPVGTLGERIAALSAHRPAVLLVDQFEEIFTAGAPEAEQDRFVAGLAAAAAGPVTVVIAIRADFYQACTRYPALVGVLEGRQVVVGPMTPDELRTVIEAPARATGQDLEEGLADTLLREAGERSQGAAAAVLPLLSHALFETWQRSGNELTLAAYRATGGIDGAVARTAEDAYASVDASDQPAMRALLLRLVSLGDGTDDTRRRLPLAELAEDAGTRRVLDALVKARLVTVDTGSAEIAHEAMLYAWPRLRAWIEEDRAALLARQHLEDAARAWDQAGRQDGDLYRETRLEATDQAVHERPGVAGTLSAAARAFLDASLRLRDREQREARRRIVRLRAAVAGFAALALVAAAAAGYSVVQRQQAVHNLATVNSAALAAAAAAADTTDPGLAAQLAVAAYRSAPTEEAASELYSVLDTPLDRVLTDTGSKAVPAVAAEPGGPLAASIDAKQTIWIYDLADPRVPVLDARVRAGFTEAIAFLPRRTAHPAMLAGPCPSGVKTLCLWNLADPRRPAVIARLPAPADFKGHLGYSSMAASPDGTLVAAASERGRTPVWSIADPARPRLIAELPNPTRTPGSLASVAFNPRGDLLAETILDGQTRLWRITAAGAPPAVVTTIRTGYASIAFGPANSPAGSLLSAAGNQNIGLWNVADPAHPTPFTATMNDAASILSAAFSTAISPDGADLVYGSNNTFNSTAQLCVIALSAVALSSSGGALPDCVPTGFGTTSLAYTEGGALLSGGLDGVVRLWRNALPQASGPNVSNTQWDVNPAGRMMAAVVNTPATGKPSAVQIWDMAAPGGPLLDATLPGAAGVRYVSDTTLLTFGSGTARLWDLAAPRHPVRGTALGAASSQWASVAGNVVAVQGGDGSVTLWRVTSAAGATRLGSFPDPGVGSGDVGLTADGRAAIGLTNANTEWWDTTDPARPMRTTDTAPTGAAEYGVTSAHGVAVVEGQPGTPGQATLYVFDVSHGPPRTEAAHVMSGTANLYFDVSADGMLLAATNADDKRVNLWDISDPRQPRPLPTITAESGITGLALSPDNHQLAVWDPKGTLQLWDISNPGKPQLTATVTIAGPDGQAQQFNDVRYLPDGSKLLVSATSSVYVLDASPTAIAARLCGYTGASVIGAQWQQYAPHIPYQNPCG